jgi:hypothetical protein
VKAYKDTVPPTASGVYLLDESGKRRDTLSSGRLDVVVDAFDRDDDSKRNLEVTSIAFDIADDAGHTLLAQPRCRLADIIDSLAVPYSTHALQLMDFEGARAQVNGAWPFSDSGNPSRHFRYALTQLAVKDGRCTVLDDADGFLDVPDATSRVVVHVTLWDSHDNVTDERLTLARDPASTDPPRRLVTFEVAQATTSWGDQIYALGSAPQMGAWRPKHGVKLTPSSYPTWRGSAWLDVGTTARFKFARIAGDGSVSWENGDNRTFVVSPQGDATYNGTWR